MKQDKWTQQLHDKLANHQVAAPEGLWADIEAALQQAEALQSPAEAPQKTIEAPRKARFISLRRWAVAASLVTALATGGYWWITHNESTQDAPNIAKIATPESVSYSRKNETESTDLSDIQKEDVLQEPSISSTKMLASGVLAVSKMRQQEIETPNSCIDETIPPTDDAMTATEEAPAVIEEMSRTTALTPEETIIRQLEKEIAQISAKESKLPSVNLYAMNGFGDQTGSNGVRMSDERASKYRNSPVYGTATRAREVIWLVGYEERQKHHQPLSFGLTASYPLTRRLSLSSGVVFTKLQSEFAYIMPTRQIDKEQTLYYLGIPLTVNYRLWSYQGLKIYASAGGQADWNIHIDLKTSGVSQEMAKDRMQWSVNGSLGIQYDIVPQVGLYAEPGIKYYFDNGSRVQNFFKDKPTNFNLQVGLRLNLGK